MRRAILVLVVWSGVARAQTAPIEVVAEPFKVTATSCAPLDITPGALLDRPQATGTTDVPVPWNELVVEGPLVDDRATVHALLETAMQPYASSLTPKIWPEVAAITARYGYQLVGHVVEGTKLKLTLEPLPIIRRVHVDIKGQGPFDHVLDDEIKRRLRLRAGTYLPWPGAQRGCALLEEEQRLRDYLVDEGYADAEVTITAPIIHNTTNVRVKVDRGPKYKIDLARLEIPPPPKLNPNDSTPTFAVSDAEIKDVFRHRPWHLIIDWGSDRFTRTQLQEDVKKVKELFQKRGFPAVRVEATYDPKTSFDRNTYTVHFRVLIDERRQLDVKFEGIDHDAVSDDNLRAQLTFNQAGSADDVEAAASARALTTWFQNSGHFDTHVTWRRDQLGPFDRITFFIDPGQVREVAKVEFVGASAIPGDTLRDLVATKEARLSGDLLGTNTAASSVQLAADVDRVVEAYRRAGYRDARVAVNVAPAQSALGDAALTTALAMQGEGDGLYVRFTVDQGPPTLLTRITFKTPTGEPIRDDNPRNPMLCSQLIAELATELAATDLVRGDATKCVATSKTLKFREDDVVGTRDRLRDYLFKTGRPRAVVELDTPEQVGPHAAGVTYTVSRVDQLKIGKVVLRGNFRTADTILLRELGFHEGQLLTEDAIAEAARRLRITNLFDAVNIEFPDLAGSSEVINAIVRVEERYDYLSQFEVGGGLSSYSGAFGTLGWTQNNIAGIGLQFIASGTLGTKIKDLESTIRVPKWLNGHWSPIDFETDVTVLAKQQDTPEFGQLETIGVTFAPFLLSGRQPRTATSAAHSWTVSLLHFDFRRRSRDVDALRPVGADTDDTQVAISTDTGSFGITAEWEARVDRHGQLSPLAPEDGFRLYASASYATPTLYSQDTFAKISGSATRLFPIGTNLVLRFDARYDQGFPLAGSVLLPDVERFFAGGDSTVRGYADDSLAKEIVQVGVPPIGNISQIRVLPAGGNIRVLASADAQVRVAKVLSIPLAGALFSDAGIVTNAWSTVTTDSIRPSVGMGLRALTPFGIGALEYAVPIHPELGDDPRGRIHFYFAARAQF